MNATLPATDKQIAFIKRLVADGRSTQLNLQFLDDGDVPLSRFAAGQEIDRLLSTPADRALTTRLSEPGMYRTADGVIYKVQKSRLSDNLYAKKLVPINTNRLNEYEQIVHWEFQYTPGAMKFLKASDRLTLDEAKAFGIKYGVCCVCGAKLSDPNSIAAGIGPVCAERV